jgi:hypothetical protein
MALTPEEKEIMAWGAESFKGPWVDLTNIFQRLHRGEDLSKDEALVDPYFVPFDIDGRILYKVLKTGGSKAILGENGSMLSIITNTCGDEIIWAAVERSEDGAYTEFHPLSERLGEEWAKKGAEYLYNNEMEIAFNHFAEWLRSQPGYSHIDLGILKVANVQFFGAFKKAYEDSDDGAKMLLMGVKMVDAVNEIMEEGWIRFYPDINLKKLLEVVAPALNFLSPVNSALQGLLDKLPF